MNATLPVKYPLENCTIKCNLALLLLVFWSVSFVNFAEARDVTSHDKVLYLVDFQCIADSAFEDEVDDHSVDFTYENTTDFGIAHNAVVVSSKTLPCLNFSYLRPLTRAPPKVLI
ncbi:hypothetical protein [uncultured Paraglaciecola sp.]|uniref:hypothetical protein n=1 Tax=uncultured Paraglaciecola sp. TaxID=1765024 RepID=UPI0030DA4AF5|tara:strand:- start:41665 stop:42009 length:345 start_codon:yes stop_codon:yes gene_type:complete